MIQQAIDVLMGDYAKLFERESFRSIILDDRQPNESICLDLHGLSRLVQPSVGLDNISAFLKTRVNAYIHFADTEAEEQLRYESSLLSNSSIERRKSFISPSPSSTCTSKQTTQDPA